MRAHGKRFCVAMALTAATVVGVTDPARAGFTETVPEGMGLVDLAYKYSWVDGAYNNEGEFGPLIDVLRRYEPGGGLQGVITPDVKVRFHVLLTQAQIGVLEDLTLGVAVPLVLKTTVEPELKWEQGDYQWALGRSYSEDDFGQWAESMGQPKPERWEGNKYTLSDIVLGGRWRWTDRLGFLEPIGLHSAFLVMGALPTGNPAEPEEIVSAGTTLWELHTQGDLAMHMGIDKTFKDSLDGRLRLGVDLFYEIFWERTYDTPRGEKHPLLLNFDPYVGDTYKLDPGDFMGFSAQVDLVPIKGPEKGNWITKGDDEKAKKLPPVLSLYGRYTYTYLFQSDWTSNSDLWDWEKEKLWRPGYKNIITLQAMLGMFRWGVPLNLYVNMRSLTWLPGKNTRTANVFSVGLQAPVPLW